MDNFDFEQFTDTADNGNAAELLHKNNYGEKTKTTFKNDLFDWLEILVSAIVLLVVLFTFVFKVVTINGPSMRDTLQHGQKLIISNIGYTPKYGDIVVISRNANNIVDTEDSDKSIIKRVIATGGQTVDIDFEKGVVYVDGVALEEPYVRTPTNRSFDVTFPVIVPEGCVFVMGDNRNNSTDSRSSFIGDEGMVDTRYILGKALFRIYPFDTVGGLY